MIQALLARAHRRFGARYLSGALFIQQQLLYPVIVLAVAGLSAYVHMSFGEFVRLSLLGCGLQLVYSLLTQRVTRRLFAPIVLWLEGARTDQATTTAWRAASCLPQEIVRRAFLGSLGLVLWGFYLVWTIYLVWQLKLPAYSGALLYVGIMVLISYAVALRFFGVEQVVRPVLRDIAAALPDKAPPPAPGLSVRARLLAALPAINVITAVGADALTRGGQADLTDLAVVVLIATAVAGTLSFVLTLLLSNSISEPILELRAATERVGKGDFSARVPIVTTDETGDLARSFNAMAAGLAERERIRDAFGTYVDREVAEHILREGTSLAGEEVEVTMLFLDIRDFTGYAERRPAAEVVGTLNRLFERLVPIIHEHHGHVDKFVGDGLLAVFGAPRRQADHADQALAAAVAMARAVEEEFGDELGVGIGLNSGTVVAGNVGGAGRLEFSVIGDAVNVAARVESATRETGDTILISESTRRLLRRGQAQLEQRTGISLKGKREAVALFAPDAS